MTNKTEQRSYNSILKTTGLIGFVQVIGIALGILRTKAIALILGPGGFGVFSLYNSLLEFTSTACQFGLGSGGVRNIAVERADNNQKGIGQIVFILRTWILASSSVALLLIVFFSKQLSYFQFNNEQYRWGIIIISFAVFFGNFYNINIAILNGVREVKTMAKVQILAAIWGVTLALPVLYFFRQEGIEMSILVVFLANFVVSTIFIRKLNINSIIPDKAEFKKHFKSIFAVGISYAIPGVFGTGLLYVSRFYLKEILSYEVLGIYQACVVLSTLYVQTIVSAMGVDFLPNLMSVKDDNNQLNKKISEQMELGLLLASIGVFATFIFAPYVLQLFYTHEFIAGTTILRWQVLAVFLRVLEWPLGYATTAKNKNFLYLILQISYLSFEFLMLYFFTHLWGIKGLGASYFVAYILFFFIRLITVRKITGFRFTPLLEKILIFISGLLVAILVCFFLFNTITATIIASVIMMVYIYWSNQVLKKEMEIDLFSIVGKKLKAFTNK